MQVQRTPPVFSDMEARNNSIYIVYNPAAGPKRNFDLEAAVRTLGRNVVIERTSCPGEAKYMAAKAAAAGFQIVTAAGGDGTVNEVAHGLLGTNVALAILPLGSGNGLARHLGIPMNPLKALSAISEASAFNMDVGRINGRPFFCTAGIGFDAHVARHFARMPRRGLTTYLQTVIARYSKYGPTIIDTNVSGKHLNTSCFLMVFANASQYGNNAFIAPHADLSDGLLDICLLDNLPLPRAIRAGLALMTGSLPVSEQEAYHTSAAISVTCSNPMEFHVDGEFAGKASSFEIALSPLELRVAFPAQKKRRSLLM